MERGAQQPAIHHADGVVRDQPNTAIHSGHRNQHLKTKVRVQCRCAVAGARGIVAMTAPSKATPACSATDEATRAEGPSARGPTVPRCARWLHTQRVVRCWAVTVGHFPLVGRQPGRTRGGVGMGPMPLDVIASMPLDVRRCRPFSGASAARGAEHRFSRLRPRRPTCGTLDGMEVRAGASPHVIVGCRAGVGPGR